MRERFRLSQLSKEEGKGFLQTPPRGDALAGRYPFTSIRLGRGLAPPSCRTCSAHVDTHGLTPVALAAEDSFVLLRVSVPSDSRERTAFTHGLAPVVLRGAVIAFRPLPDRGVADS